MGTDGFGRSDTRENLRDFFEIDYKHIIIETLFALLEDKKVTAELLQKTLQN